MIYRATLVSDSNVDEAYREGMTVLNGFWGINWQENIPDIFIIGDRSEINKIKGKMTRDQLVGWSKGRGIFVLEYQKVIESSFKLTKEQYKALIKHELNHLFYGIVSGEISGPLWLNEGLSIFLSGQTTLGQWERPSEFRGFIESDASEENKKFAYAEGGFVIELLVNKYGKDKLIQLVRQLKSVKDSDGFKTLFTEIFGIELSYKSINELYLK